MQNVQMHLEEEGVLKILINILEVLEIARNCRRLKKNTHNCFRLAW